MDLNWALIAPVIILEFILMIVALVDVIKSDDTNGPKWLWVLVILFIGFLGPILYFVIGRKR
ncbi:PLD nuclease N-terminal domain-containing protein [Pseudalkalibacillus caeni]|nr:PLD nuclease N-terminal domain-containing protein [Pseudalkalibacillus caeni]